MYQRYQSNSLIIFHIVCLNCILSLSIFIFDYLLFKITFSKNCDFFSINLTNIHFCFIISLFISTTFFCFSILISGILIHSKAHFFTILIELPVT